MEIAALYDSYIRNLTEDDANSIQVHSCEHHRSKYQFGLK